MPGPHNKPKKKSRPTGGSTIDISALSLGSTEADAELVAAIEENKAWWQIVDLLCEKFNIPDLTTRSSFKKVNASFERYWSKLDGCYETHAGRPLIQAGVVAIYSRLVVDSVIRNKLFAKGFLEKLWPLLEIPSCSHLVFRCLKSASQHGGLEVRNAVALQSALILRVLRSHATSDPVLLDTGIAVLAHAAMSIMGTEPPTSPLLRAIEKNVVNILDLIVETVKAPNTTLHTFAHALSFLSSIAVSFQPHVLSHPSAPSLLVGCLRAPLISTRANAMCALLRLYMTGRPEERENMDPQRMMRLVQSNATPLDVSDAIMDYGMMRSELFVGMAAVGGLTKEMMNLVQQLPPAERANETGQAYCDLGKKIAGYVLTTEYSVPQGEFLDDRGKSMSHLLGLPFNAWADVLPICCKALRFRSSSPNSDEAKFAEMLELKYGLIQPSHNRHTPTLVAKAEKASAKWPKEGYFYYARALLTTEMDIMLQWSKKGLKCRGLSPWLRSALMERAIFAEVDLAREYLQELDAYLSNSEETGEDGQYALGMALLRSALEDCRDFMKSASPDNRRMKAVMIWYCILEVTSRGREITGLEDLKDTITRLALIDKISALYFGPIAPTQARSAWNLIHPLYKNAAREWDGHLAKFGAKRSGSGSRDVGEEEIASPGMKRDEDEKKLDEWLEELDHGHSHAPGVTCSGAHCHSSSDSGGARKREVLPDLKLYTCTWCGNPSASLKRCSKCEVARYCDAACQKAHWDDGHKKGCKKAGITPGVGASG